jgi:diguanylate cyclase (GGDEF)-like protein
MSSLQSNSLRSGTYFEAFADEFQRDLNRAIEDDAVLSLVLFDIDWFGKANADHGREVGDALLGELASYLNNAIEGRGRVMRYGGDAHMAVLPGVEKEEAFLFAEHARRGFDRKHIVTVDGRAVELSLTLSAGVASYPDDDAKAAELFRKVNEALYRAKVSGRNKACLAREEKMQTKTSHYTQGQLAGLARLAKREGIGEAVLLREALTDVLRKYNS